MSETLLIRRVAVLGAGVMGAQIAAQLVNAGIDTVLFDLPAKEGDKNGIVQKAIANLTKLSPAPLGVKSLAEAIVPANYETDLGLLESCDLVPFQSIIAQEGSVPFVMVTHPSYPNVTGSDTPADLSSAIVTDILRDKLGYQNVIITDSQSMSSITDHYSAGEAAVQALAAGCDMILMPSDLQGAFDAVKAAVADGTLTQSRIDESVLRILTVKAEYGILQ